MSRREFHFQEGTSSKFWAIDVQGASFTVQYGRLGTAGQTQTKDFASDAEAQKNADKLIAEKTKKGYIEVGSTAATAPPAAATAPKAKAKPTPPASTAAATVPSVPTPVITRKIDLCLRTGSGLWDDRDNRFPEPPVHRQRSTRPRRSSI